MAVMRWASVVIVVIVVATLVGLGIAAFLPVPFVPRFPAWLRLVGALVALGGVALGLWTFRHHPARLMAEVTARTIEIGVRKLDPASSAVKRLITTGPYRYIRNPIYLSVFLLMVGLALAVPLTGLFLSAALLFVWWNVVVIPPEEKELAAIFGEEYARYRQTAGRFIPKPGQR